MALAASTVEILDRLERAVLENFERGWAEEPPAARMALLVREELERWTRSAYPGSTCEGSGLDRDSRRRLALTIHSAPTTHRVEIRGMACGDPLEGVLPPGGPEAHSWVVLAHWGAPCRNLEAAADLVARAGLRRVDRRETPRLSLSLWMGRAAPEGCPDCRAALEGGD